MPTQFSGSALRAAQIGSPHAGRTLGDHILAAVAGGGARVCGGAAAVINRVLKISLGGPVTPPCGASRTERDPAVLTQVAPLIYELLDAHDDTAQLASELALDQIWDVHLAYLRKLQRTGREVLAELSRELG